MRSLLAIFLISGSMWASDQPPVPPLAGPNLLPTPASIHVSPGGLKLNGSFTVASTGVSDGRLERAIRRFQRRLEAKTGIQVPLGLSGNASAASLTVQCGAASPQFPELGEDESYSLDIDEHHAVLKANRVTGAIRGLETLLQLVEADSNGYVLRAISIQDQPRFAWRGLMIDASRHWQPVDVIKRNLDGMATVKMNVFHWHLSDDQGFRIESKRHPKLQEMGSDGLFYTQEQVRDIVQYAADRGIRVVPEFDMPGHATSWFVGYPELASGPGPYQVERKFGIFDAAMDPTREETYKFLDGFLGEMAQLFPDQYIHVGGDESTGKQWLANPRIREFMSKHQMRDPAALQAYFTGRVQKILQKHGKKMAGWEEILGADLPKDAIAQSWRGPQSLMNAAKQGYGVVYSYPYYFDHMGPAEFFYSNYPLPADAGLTPEQTAKVLGGEACAFSEFLSPENIDSRIWPRNAALAERLWSPREVNNVADMYRRLQIVSVGLEQDGLTHISAKNEMLRQMSGMPVPQAIEILADVAGPFGIADRQKIRVETQLTPLTRMSDAVIPDPPFGRQFAQRVDQLLTDAPAFAAQKQVLAEKFQQWRDLGSAFPAIAANAPILADCEPKVRSLQSLGTAGLEALQYLQTHTTPPQEWKTATLALINQAETPDQSILKFPWLGSYRALILAAANVDGLQTTTPQLWKEQVMREAAAQEPKVKYTW
jgi:hexosaminidase